MSSPRQRNRGFLLTDAGKLKLEVAKQEAELNNSGKRYTVEQLSQITKLDLSTITRIFGGSRCDRRTLENLFKAFNLKLEAQDFYKPEFKEKPKQDKIKPVYYPANNSNIHGRERELKQLKECLLKERSITLFGAIGVGKTALAIKLVESVKDSFKYICWQSLESNSRSDIAIAILNSFDLKIDKQDFNSLVTQLIVFLQQQRCLIVFDDVEIREREVMVFLNYLRTVTHQSCIILISRQKLAPILSNSRSFIIENIDSTAGKKLLREYSIFADNKTLDRVIQSYDAHPLSLHLAATTILDIFNGDVGEFITHNPPTFNEIEKVFNLQLKHFSSAEISILYWLTINIEPISLDV